MKIQRPGAHLGAQAMVYTWRVRGDSSSNFQNHSWARGPGSNWGPKLSPSYGLHSESPYKWIIIFKLSSSWARGPGPNWGPKLWFTFGRVHTSGESFSKFQALRLLGQGPEAQLGAQAMVYPWRVCIQAFKISVKLSNLH